MTPDPFRVALFSGNYNYTRDGANQTLNRLVGHLLDRGVAVSASFPTSTESAILPVSELSCQPDSPTNYDLMTG